MGSTEGRQEPTKYVEREGHLEPWRPAIEEYGSLIERLLRQEDADRRLEAIDREIERVAESVREGLEAQDEWELAAALERAAEDATQGLDTPRSSLEYRARRLWGTTHVPRKEAGERAYAARDELHAAIERIRLLREVREFIEEQVDAREEG